MDKRINLEGRLVDADGNKLRLGYVTSTEGDKEKTIKKLQQLINMDVISMRTGGYCENSHTRIMRGLKVYRVDYGSEKSRETDYSIEDVVNEVVAGLSEEKKKEFFNQFE